MATLDPTGFVARTTNDWLEHIRNRVRSSPLFGPFSNLRPGSRLGTLAGIVAEMAGLVSENQQSLYDSRSRDNAVGAALDNLAGLIRRRRRPESRSTAFVRFTGTGPVPSGTLAERSSTGDRFEVVEGVDGIPISGFIDLKVQALDFGPMNILAGEIDELVTPLPGVTTITNTENGFSGSFVETDAELRWRMEFDTEATGSATVEAIRSALNQSLSDGSFSVFENDTNTDFVDPDTGYVLKAYSIGVVAWPPTLDQAAIAQAIWETRAAGTPTSGSESSDVIDSMGRTHTMFFEFAFSAYLEVEVDFSDDTPEDDFPFPTAEATTKDVTTSYTSALDTGRKFRPFELVCLLDEALPAANSIVVRVRRKGSGDPFQTIPLTVGLVEKFEIEAASDITYIAPPVP